MQEHYPAVSGRYKDEVESLVRRGVLREARPDKPAKPEEFTPVLVTVLALWLAVGAWVVAATLLSFSFGIEHWLLDYKKNIWLVILLLFLLRYLLGRHTDLLQAIPKPSALGAMGDRDLARWDRGVLIGAAVLVALCLLWATTGEIPSALVPSGAYEVLEDPLHKVLAVFVMSGALLPVIGFRAEIERRRRSDGESSRSRP